MVIRPMDRDVIFPPGYISVTKAIEKVPPNWTAEELENGRTSSLFGGVHEPSDPDLAWGRLRHGICRGELRGFVFTGYGEIIEPDLSAWRGTAGGAVMLFGNLEFKVAEELTKGIVMFLEADLDDFLAGRTNPQEAKPSSISRPKPPPSQDEPAAMLRRTYKGRKQKYDWDGILIEAARIVYYEGRPNSQNELIDKVIDWHGRTYKGPPPKEEEIAPDASTVKPYINRFWHALRLNED